MEDSSPKSIEVEIKSEAKSDDSGELQLDQESESSGFKVLDMVEEPYEEAASYCSDEEELDKVLSNCDSSSDWGSVDDVDDQMETVNGDDHMDADSQSSESDMDDMELDEVLESIDENPGDYEECYVAERPPSPVGSPIPKGWKKVYHESGATIYVHLETNVCSLSRPYFLGTNSTKFHMLPSSPVPCLSYRTRRMESANCAAASAAASAAVSDANSATVSDIESAAASAVDSAAVPDTESEAMFDTESAAMSDADSAAASVANGAAVSDVESAAVSIANSAAVPGAESTAMSDADSAAANSAGVSDVESAAASTANSAAVPDAESGAMSDTDSAAASADNSAVVFDANSAATSTTNTAAPASDAPASDVDFTDAPSSVTCSANAAAVSDPNPDTGVAVCSSPNPADFVASPGTCPFHAAFYPMDSEDSAANAAPSDANAVASVSSTTSGIDDATSNSAPSSTVTSSSTSNAVAPEETNVLASSVTKEISALKSNSTVPKVSPSVFLKYVNAPASDKRILRPISVLKNDASTSNATAPDEDTIAAGSSVADAFAHTSNDRAEEKRVLEYCKRLFKFKKIKYLKFRSWDVRRSYLRALRNERNRRKCPFSNNKFVSFPMETRDDEGNVVWTKKWIINPRGRSYVAILHEYLQQSEKTQPEYKFSEVDNSRNPYAATVEVNGTEYGTGYGMSKKEAKFEAAKATLEVLLPKMMKYVLSVCCNKSSNKKEEDCSDDDYTPNVASVFDDIEITDPRVTELSVQTTEPKPYELLLNCLQKRPGSPEVAFDFQAESMESSMSVGEHKVTVKCTNKREGKQLAAQAMLQLLHPHVKHWGSLLRLYSNYISNQYRKMTDDKDLYEMKCKPENKELLDALKHKMRKLPEAQD